MDDDAIRASVHKENDEFRRVEEKHQQYEEELEAIADLAFLSPEKQLKKQELKKRKLQIKDQMHQIILDHQEQA